MEIRSPQAKFIKFILGVMISIIIPVFNADKYLPSCISSIILHENIDFEIILVDDGSTDESAKIIDSMALKDSRIISVHKQNGGVGTARNVGLDIAKGDFVYFADADDMLYPNGLSKLLSHMKDGIDLVIGGYEEYYSDGSLKSGKKGDDILTLSREDSIQQLYKPTPYTYQGFIWNKLFRRKIIIDNHLRFDEDIIFNEDRLFVANYISVQNGKTIYDFSPVYRYFIRDESAMGSLKNGFNPKFVTDFIALTRMKKIIKRTFHSHSLNAMSDDGILLSYFWIHQMMEQSGMINKSIHTFLKRELIKNTSLLFLLKERTHILMSRLSSYQSTSLQK